MKKQTKNLTILSLFLIVFIGMYSCSSNEVKNKEQVSENIEATHDEELDPLKVKGVGPVSSITLEDINKDLADKGAELFTSKCSACHAIDKKVVGPALAGITTRRSPEWIMNMILNPEVMVKEDPIAKELLAEYMAPMSNQSLTQEEARILLEHFRDVDSKK